MYDIKWKNDLKMYIKTFNNFVFEGNVNDLQPVETNDGYKYLPLNEAIAELYGEPYLKMLLILIEYFRSSHLKCFL